MKPSEGRVRAGQAVYTPKILSVYDIVVLGISNSLVWKCPSERIEAHYNANLTDNHLDIGVGTGYFPDRCQFPSDHPRIALMDLNPNTLAFASKRLARCQPETYRQNILNPIEHNIVPFDSIGMNDLFHCVPGSMTEKAVAFDHLRKLMNQRPNRGRRLCGVIFRVASIGLCCISKNHSSGGPSWWQGLQRRLLPSPMILGWL